MFKMVFTLAAALYAAFVIYGEPLSVAEVEVASAERVPTLPLAAAAADATAQAAVTRSRVRDALISDAPAAAAIAAAAPAPAETYAAPARIGEPVRISLIERTEAVTPVAAAQDESATGDRVDDAALYRVTGSRVNLRAGPSTGNAVVDSLVRGTMVERIGERAGWIELRDLDTGLTGYMSARFLEPA